MGTFLPDMELRLPSGREQLRQKLVLLRRRSGKVQKRLEKQLKCVRTAKEPGRERIFKGILTLVSTQYQGRYFQRLEKAVVDLGIRSETSSISYLIEESCSGKPRKKFLR
jgi:hypothetical protein